MGRRLVAVWAGAGRLWRGYWPALVYLAVALLVMGPLLVGGFILHYDMVFAPRVGFDWEALRSGTMLLQKLPELVVLWVAGLVLPMEVVQKLVLAGILFVSGYTMFRVVPVKVLSARFVAGLFYEVNPLVYDRFMAGHWLFLLGYAFTPLVLCAFWRLYTRPGVRAVVVAGAAWAAVATVSPHHLIILGVMYVAMGAAFVRTRQQVLAGFGGAAVTVVLVSGWLIPMYLFPNVTDSFGLEHFYAFATKPDPVYGMWFNMAALQGFWYSGWVSLKNFTVWWPALWLVWLAPVFVALGGWRVFSGFQKRLAAVMVAASLVAMVLAAGPDRAVVAFNAWVFVHVPGMSGLREPQKLLGIVALTYAVLTGFGMEIAQTRLLKRRRWKWGAAAVAVTAVLAMSYPLFWAGHGQLRTVRYPQSWYRFSDLLRASGGGKVLVLPYELYVDGGFSKTLVAQPAKAFFGARAVVGDKMNMRQVDQSRPSEEKYAPLEAALGRHDIQGLTQACRTLGITYIMLTQFDDSSDYEWVRAGSLRPVFEDAELLAWSIE